MTETINRIEEALDQNWPVEAEDIRALVEAYKEKKYESEFNRLQEAQTRIIKELESYNWTHEEISEIVQLLWEDKPNTKLTE